MLTSMLIYNAIVFYFFIIPCENLELFENGELMSKITSAVFKRHRAQCGTILHPSRLHDSEYQHVHSLEKKLITEVDFWKSVSSSSFKKYLKVGEAIETKCPTMAFIVIGWLQNTQKEFSEFTYKVPRLGVLWLVFLKNISVEKFLEEAHTPFFMDIILASLESSNSSKLKEAYRVRRGYPLRVIDYGEWRNGEFISPSDLSIYSRRYDLEGVSLRATTKDDYPLCFLKRDENEYKIGGYFGALFHELAKDLNFTTKYVHAKKNVTGAPTNGTWDRLLGMLQRNEIDLSVGPHPLNHNVMNVGTFVRPLFRTRYSLFFKQEGNRLEWGAIWKPFDYTIWTLICSWIFISGVVMNKLYAFECRFDNEDYFFRKEFSWLNSFFTSLKAICQQGNEFIPKSNSCRALFLTTYLLSTIIVTAYSASLISYLTTKEPTRPFDSLETFLKDGSYKIVAIGSSTDYMYFSEATDPLRKEIYERFVKTAPESKSISKKEDGLDVICTKKKYALFITFDIPVIIADRYSEDPFRKCVVIYLKSHLDTTFLSIVRRKDLPYGDFIDTEVIKYFECGIAQRLQKNAWPLSKKPSDEGKKFYEVTLDQVLQIHLILWFGMGLSIIIAILEIIIYYHKRISV